MPRLGVRHWLRLAFVAARAVASAATSRLPCPWYVRESGQGAGCATLELGARRAGRGGADLLVIGGAATPTSPTLTLAPHQKETVKAYVTTEGVTSDAFTLATECGGCL